MLGQFMMQHLAMLMASSIIVVASAKDPEWRKIAESGRMVNPPDSLKGREVEPGM